jgi:hypothetical protein
MSMIAPTLTLPILRIGPLPLPHSGRGAGLLLSRSRERNGPIAKQWEGEGMSPERIN